MSQTHTILALPLIGTYAMTLQDGERLHDAIATPLKAGTPVLVDFDGVSVFTSVFLNVAIGRLYGEFPEALLKTHLSFSHLSDIDQELLQIVIRNAQEYFTNPAVREAVNAMTKRYNDTGEI